MSANVLLRLAMAPGAVGLLAGLWLIQTSDPGLAVKSSPPTVTCVGPCQTCLEMEHTQNGDRCVKCGVDPKCLGKSADPGLSPDVTAILNAHNAYRRTHCAPALTWSPQLAEGAQAWANACTRQHSREAWSNANCCGENLYWGSGAKGDADDAIKWWYDEIRKYNFAAPVWSNDTSHFTQVVWKGSKQIGCAVARCGNENYWVCRYSPTGNWNVNQPGVLAANVGCAQPVTTSSRGQAGTGKSKLRRVATASNDVDIYDGPGGHFRVIGMMPRGTSAAILEKHPDGWCKLDKLLLADGKAGSGWVAQDHLVNCR